MGERRQDDFGGLRVVSFESRRAHETAELIRRYRGQPVMAPSLREVPIAEDDAAFDFLSRLESGSLELVIFTTGVGTRALIRLLESRHPRARIVAALGGATLVARGPKPVAALRELGLSPTVTAAQPYTWRELVAALDGRLDLHGKEVAVQEYGAPNAELLAELRRRGAAVFTVAVYRWALPEDLAPLRRAIEEITRGEVQVALFTNGAQVGHLFRTAELQGETDSLRAGLERVVIGSIGPVCTEVLEQFDLRPDIEPAHPKLGSLMAEAAASAKRLLAAKRQQSDCLNSRENEG
ncbi:MAG TPA: uroporphyrinogen-III synthase [candidate division Zixibacteria bacterium]|nr:uroporphyrinogen-III synthase [candidate division Zixibacteria bacterium]